MIRVVLSFLRDHHLIRPPSPNFPVDSSWSPPNSTRSVSLLSPDPLTATAAISPPPSLTPIPNHYAQQHHQMAKRGNANAQQRREEYEHENDREAEDPGEDFNKASVDILKKRRIISISAKKKNVRGNAGAVPSGGESAKALNSTTTTAIYPPLTPPPLQVACSET